MKSKTSCVVMLFLCAMCVPVSSAAGNTSIGFDDFLPDDPIQDLKDMGVWSNIILIIGVLAILAVISSLGAILMGVSFSNIGSIAKSTTMANHGSLTIIRVVVTIMIALSAISVVFYLWNG